MFDSLVHKDAATSNMGKFHFLKGALKEDAQKVVEVVEVTSGNYDVVWKLLCDLTRQYLIMVRIYVRKTERQNWTIESMEQAIEAAENGMCIRSASTTFNVPRMALKRRIIRKRTSITTQSLRSLGSFHCVFTDDQEAELIRYIFDMETRYISEKAINNFKKTAIVPFDRNLFTDLDFAPAEVSEKDENVPDVAEHIPRMDANTAQPTPGTSRDVQSHPIPRTDATGDNNVADAIANLPLKISAIDIRPLPNTTTSIKMTNRQKGKTAILTSSPYENELWD
ncbi:hypothetical protein JTB14_014470 [Gonioctena quinquepunctata]|nr:hypothetical protein JTB14_014470 [Gonioctena quinquepunctata]